MKKKGDMGLTIILSIIAAGAILLASSAFSEAGTERNFRFYWENGTSFTQVNSTFGFMTDNPNQNYVLDVNGSILMNGSEVCTASNGLCSGSNPEWVNIQNYPTSCASLGNDYTVSVVNSVLTCVRIIRQDNPQTTNTTQASRWNGTHFILVNLSTNTGGSGISGITATNPDNYLNLSTNGTNIAGNINLTPFDIRYTIKTIYDAFTSAIYTNVTTIQNQISVLQTFNAAIYTNVTNNQVSITTVNATKLNITDQRYNDTAAINALSTFAQNKAATGTITCGTGQVLMNVTSTNGTLTGQCVTDQTGGGNGGGNFSEFRVTNTTSSTTLYNNSLLTIEGGSNVVVDQTGGTFTISASVSGGSGNVSGNGTTGYVPIWNGATTLTTGNLLANNSRISVGNGVASEFFINGYSKDNYALPYFQVDTTEFCEGGLANNIPVGPFRATLVSSGSVGSQAGEPEHPCIMQILDSTTANGGVWFMTSTDSLRLNGTENTTSIWKRSANNKPGQVTVRHGFHDTVQVGEPTDGCYWQFNFTTTTNVAYGVCSSNSVRTVNTTTFAPINNTWYITNVEIAPNAARAIFRTWNENGTLVLNTTISTNIPVNVGRETGAGWGAFENNTGASSSMVLIDYMDLKIGRRTRRIPWLK